MTVVDPRFYWPKGVFFLRTLGKPVFERSESYEFVAGVPDDRIRPRVGDESIIAIIKQRLGDSSNHVRVQWHQDALGRWWLVEIKK